MSNNQNSSVPKIVALEVLEKNGVDVERLKELIKKDNFKDIFEIVFKYKIH